MKKTQKSLLLTTLLSIFGVGVAAISTFAWFQLDATANTGIDTSSGSSPSVTVNSITGYKGRGAELKGDPEWIYSSTKFTTLHYDVNGTASNNIDEDVENPISIDTPEGGVGYYILGNAAFTGSSATAWKYSGAVKMTESPTENGDKAYLGNVYMDTDSEIKIYHHYYRNGTYGVETADDKYNYGLVNSGTAGYYDVFLSSSNVVYVSESVGNGSGVLSRGNKVVSRSNSLHGITGDYVYFSYNGTNWGDSGAWPMALFINGSGDYHQGYDASYGSLYRYAIPSGTWTKIEFYRMMPGTNTNSALVKNTSYWNKTGEISSGFTNNNRCCELSGWDSGTFVALSNHLTVTLKGSQWGSWSTPNDFTITEVNSDYCAKLTNITINHATQFKIYVNSDAKGDNYIGYQFGSRFTDSAGYDDGADNNVYVNSGSGNNYAYDIYYRLSDSKFDISLHSIVLDRQSGTTGSTSINPIPGNPMPDITAPTRTGYTFGGYYTETSGGGTQYYSNSGTSTNNWNISAGETLYAKWTAKTYTVTLNRAGAANGTASVTATYGSDMPSATMPTRTGYTFGGYFTGVNGAGTKYYNSNGTSARTWNIDSDTTLYAKWTAKQSTVNLDQQGYSTTGSTSVTATYGSAMPSITLPVKTNYTFQGYFTERFGKGTKYYNSDGSSAKNCDFAAEKTLYAHWTHGGGASGTTIYTYVSQSRSWTNVFVKIWFGSNEETWYQEEKLNVDHSVSGYSNVYSFVVPANADKFLLYNGTLSGSNQTADFTSSTTWKDTFNTTNSSLSSFNMLEVQDGEVTVGGDTGKSYCVWRTFEAAAGITKGYYLTSGASSLANASNVFSFSNSTRMSYEKVHQNGESDANKAELFDVNLTENYYYQVWCYDGEALYHFDSPTGVTDNSCAAIDNCLIKSKTTGKRDIYLNASEVVTVSIHSETLAKITLNGTPYYMCYGDNVPGGGGSGYYNRYVRENPIKVSAGDTFYLSITTNDSSTDYYGATGSTSGHVVTIAEICEDLLERGISETLGGSTIYYYKFKVGGLFTFYWTKDNKISVAPIPELGYGYYILLNQGTSAKPSFSYSSCVKMTSTGNDTGTNDENRANYSRFYAAANTIVAFRSYVSDVDHYYQMSDDPARDDVYYNGSSIKGKNASSGTDVYQVNTTNQTSATTDAVKHGVVFKTPGYYDIFVNHNNVIYISKSNITESEFFKMNSISSSVSTSEGVKNANTTFVLAVKFTLSNNLQDTTINVDVIGGVSGLGSKLKYAVSTVDPGIGNESPYDYMRHYVYGYDKNGDGDTSDPGDIAAGSYETSTFTSGSCTLSTGSTITAGNSSPHIIYIFIDYNPSSISSLASGTNTGDYNFYLKVTHV